MKTHGVTVSPISSPTRRKTTSALWQEEQKQEEEQEEKARNDRREDEAEDLDDTGSEESYSLASPPPYSEKTVSLGASASRSSSHSAVYSNLMSFLDESEAKLPKEKLSSHRVEHNDVKNESRGYTDDYPPVIDVQRDAHYEEARDDISSMSYSMSSLGIGKAFKSSKYVWNEIDDDMINEDYRHENSHRSSNNYSYSDNTTFFRTPPSYLSSKRSIGEGESKNSGSLQTNIEELQEKVKSMQAELRRKNQRVKDLQSEHARLKTAKNRKIEKIGGKYQKELEYLKENNHKSLQKQKDFASKVQEAVSSLRNKAANLSEKLSSNDTTLRNRLETAKEEGLKSLRRARRQWETDEKTLFEKVLNNKRDALMKEANDRVGPKLENLVKENRERVLKKREDCENELVSRTSEYKKDMQRDFDISLRHLKERYSDDESGSMVSRNRKIEEIRHRHDGEIKSLKNRFAHDQRMLEESTDRARRLDSESHLASMEKLKHIEQKAVEDWMVKQQREINNTLQKQEVEYKSIEDEVNDMYEQWEQRRRVQYEKAHGHLFEKRKGEIVYNAKKELEDIRQKLRSEAQTERDCIRQKADEEVKQLRLSVQDKLHDQYESDEKSTEMMSVLHKEVERLQDRLYHHRTALTELRGIVEDERRKSRLLAVENNIDGVSVDESSIYSNPSKWMGSNFGDGSSESLGSSRADLSAVEEAVTSLKSRLDEELSRKEEENDRDIREAMRALDKARKEKTALDMSQHRKFINRKQELNEELSRIEEKVSKLLSRKNKAIIEMKSSLQDLQQKNQGFEEQLDEYRHKKLCS